MPGFFSVRLTYRYQPLTDGSTSYWGNSANVYFYRICNFKGRLWKQPAVKWFFKGKTFGGCIHAQFMAIFMKDKSGTYHHAKDVHDKLDLNSVTIFPIDYHKLRIFRKHLSDISRRSGLGKRFVTRYINETGNITIYRIN